MQIPVAELEKRLEQIPGRLQRLRKSGLRQISRSDPESRFLRSRDGWQLGYTAEIAVCQDHWSVTERVTQDASNNASLLPMVDGASRQCRGKPQRVSADTGFFSSQNRAIRIFKRWIPAARVLHSYPVTRFLATHPRWEPYA